MHASSLYIYISNVIFYLVYNTNNIKIMTNDDGNRQRRGRRNKNLPKFQTPISSSESDSSYDNIQQSGDETSKDNKIIKSKDPRNKRMTKLRKIPNIYTASNLEILSGGQIRFVKGRDANFDTVKVDNSIVPKLKPIYEEMGIYKQPIGVKQAHYKSPDEILTDDYKFEPNELVYLSREEIKKYTSIELPDPDITNAIHYYMAHRIKDRLGITDKEYDKNYSKFLDGSALLAFSTLVTKWIEDYCGENTFKTYMEKIRKNSSSDSNSIDEFVRVYADDDEEEEDDDEDDYDEKDEDGEIFNHEKINKKKFNPFSELKNNKSKIKSDSDDSENDEFTSNINPVRINHSFN